MLSAGRNVLPGTFVWNADQDVQYRIVFQFPCRQSIGVNYSLTFKSIEIFSLYCYDESQFLVADWQE